MIRDWDGHRKGFGTQTLYVTVVVAATALLATIAVIVFGFDASVATIVVGAGGLLLATWLSPPARAVKTAIAKIQVGDLVATALENDFLIHAAPVVAVTTVRRGAKVVTQVGTASGAAYETDEHGVLPVVRLVGFRPAQPRVFSPDAATAESVGTWAWTHLVSELLGRLLASQRNELPVPTRDQARSDLVMRLGCTPATARYALQAAAGLGLITQTNKVAATPAGAVWFACQRGAAGSRIDAPAELPQAVTTRSQSPGLAVSVIDRSVRVPNEVADVSDRAGIVARSVPHRK